jgi:predicted AAA+ superfamily ATPase
MLSSEMATVLTGKYLQVEMLPFSLEEFFDWNQLNIHELKPEQETDASVLTDDYMRNGGYPEVVASRQLTRSYLDTLFDSIVWKDVAKRHNVRNITDLNDLAMYLVSNFCNPISANELTDELGFASVTTTKKFMDYLHEPYLFYYLPRYNNKLKLMKKAPRKVYVVDNGFVAAKAFSLSDNLGRLLENQVFIELIRRGFDTDKTMFYYHSRNDKEVDFVLRKGAHIERLVQVCYDISSPKTEKREVDAIIESAEELRCNNLTIVTNNDERTIEKNGYKINVVPISKF